MNTVFKFKFILAAIFLLIFSIAITGALFKIMWPYADHLLIGSFTLYMGLFFITRYDMLVSPIRKRGIWLFGLILAPLLVGLIYTFMRDDMLEKNGQ